MEPIWKDRVWQALLAGPVVWVGIATLLSRMAAGGRAAAGVLCPGNVYQRRWRLDLHAADQGLRQAPALTVPARKKPLQLHRIRSRIYPYPCHLQSPGFCSARAFSWPRERQDRTIWSGLPCVALHLLVAMAVTVSESTSQADGSPRRQPPCRACRQDRLREAMVLSARQCDCGAMVRSHKPGADCRGADVAGKWHASRLRSARRDSRASTCGCRTCRSSYGNDCQRSGCRKCRMKSSEALPDSQPSRTQRIAPDAHGETGFSARKGRDPRSTLRHCLRCHGDGGGAMRGPLALEQVEPRQDDDARARRASRHPAPGRTRDSRPPSR